MMNGMGKNDHIQFKLIENYPDSKQLVILIDLYTAIFEDARIDIFKKRLTTKKNVLSLIAYKDNQPIGFKVGYRYNEYTFYSWVGGILKNLRNQGFAAKLAELQENWAKKNGYSKLRTKSMNRFKPMMILNLKNGFDIKQVYTNGSGQTKIIFEKNI